LVAPAQDMPIVISSGTKARERRLANQEEKEKEEKEEKTDGGK